MSAAELSLVAHELVTGYAGRRRRQKVVTRTSFTIAAGRIVAIVGANGAGKTTLLKTLMGLIPPLSGSALLDGIDIGAYRRRFGIGYLPENLTLNEHWSGRGMLALTALASRTSSESAIAAATEAAGVDFDLALPINRMSKGMRQRLALAMVLLPMPRLLLLDEPEAGLDPGQRVLLRERIRKFARDGRIALVASHDVSGICTVADEILFMKGEQLEPVSSAELNDPERLVQLFAGGVS